VLRERTALRRVSSALLSILATAAPCWANHLDDPIGVLPSRRPEATLDNIFDPTEWYGATRVDYGAVDTGHRSGAPTHTHGGTVWLRRARPAAGARADESTLEVFLRDVPRLEPGVRLVLGLARRPGGFSIPGGRPSRLDRLWVIQFEPTGAVAMEFAGSAAGAWQRAPAPTGVTLPSAPPRPHAVTVTRADGTSLTSPRYDYELRLRVATTEMQNARFMVAQFDGSSPLDVSRSAGSYPARAGGAGSTARVDIHDVSTWRWMASTPPSRSLRVMTWNIKRFTDAGSAAEPLSQPTYNGAPDFFRDAEVDACAIGRRIARSGVDIAALQEAWDAAETYQVLRCANLERVRMPDPSDPSGRRRRRPFYTSGRLSDPRAVTQPSSSSPTGTVTSSLEDPRARERLGAITRGLIQGPGGVVVLSAFPVVAQRAHVFDACKAEDCLQQKGVLHLRLHLGKTPEALPPAPAAERARYRRGPFTPSEDDLLDVFVLHANAPSSTACG